MEEANMNIKSFCSQNTDSDSLVLVQKIEDACRLYKLNEVFLNDVEGDFDKQKCARRKLEFVRQELLMLMEQARQKGVKFHQNQLIQRFFHTDL